MPNNSWHPHITALLEHSLQFFKTATCSADSRYIPFTLPSITT